MRFKRHLEFEYGFKNLEVISLISLIFLILLFFTCILNFAAEPGVRLDLGRNFSGKALSRGDVQISLPDNKSIFVNDRFVSSEDFSEMLKFAAMHKQSVLLKVSRSVSLEHIISIMNKCRNLGVSQVNIVTEK